ncbi:MAG: LysM peptidoglycan-binding domain-containing protein [Anaerolineaceae bacterium]|nr:MAG: LysM peptidoglycan-binding domain-containing protein [Anaerolineaceae bacterium]
MGRYLFLLIVLLMASGCLVQNRATSGEFINALTCQQIADHTSVTLACIPTSAGVLLQAESAQVTIQTETATVLFDSTIYWTYSDTQMQVIALDGVASVMAEGVTRLIRPAYAVRLSASPALVTVGAPAEPTAAPRDLLLNLPISNLPRPLDQRQTVGATSVPAPTAIISPTSPPDNSIQAAPIQPSDAPFILPTDAGNATCETPPDWTQVYTVSAGDTLTRIALQYDLSVAEIIAANCITNPDQLNVGQEIRLPATGAAPTAPTITPNVRAGEVTFTAERDVIVAGDCVTLSWTTSGAASVSLDGQNVPSGGSQSVCPTASITYELLVTAADGTQATYSQTITVTQ